MGKSNIVFTNCAVEEWMNPVCLQKAKAYFWLYNPAFPLRYFQQVSEEETLWSWWSMWCPLSLFLPTGQQTASKHGLFSCQKSTCSQILVQCTLCHLEILILHASNDCDCLFILCFSERSCTLCTVIGASWHSPSCQSFSSETAFVIQESMEARCKCCPNKS